METMALAQADQFTPKAERGGRRDEALTREALPGVDAPSTVRLQLGKLAARSGLHLQEGLAFLDQAHYSMVKTNTFNGVPLPSIWLWNSDDDSLREIASFGYETFRDRLG